MSVRVDSDLTTCPTLFASASQNDKILHAADMFFLRCERIGTYNVYLSVPCVLLSLQATAPTNSGLLFFYLPRRI
jgi:hypothetical protein